MVGSHISLVLLVTVALGQSFVGQPDSNLTSVARLLTFYGFMEVLKQPKSQAIPPVTATDAAGLQKSLMAPLCSSACFTELD